MGEGSMIPAVNSGWKLIATVENTNGAITGAVPDNATFAKYNKIKIELSGDAHATPGNLSNHGYITFKTCCCATSIDFGTAPGDGTSPIRYGSFNTISGERIFVITNPTAQTIKFDGNGCTDDFGVSVPYYDCNDVYFHYIEKIYVK
jgi:hypothetical protein